MSLSAIKGESTLDFAAEIIEPVCNLRDDPNTSGLFERVVLPKGTTNEQFKRLVTDRVRKYLPNLIRHHKADIIQLMAAADQCTPEEYSARLSIPKLTLDLINVVNDPVFVDLFMPAQTEPSSGAAPESTPVQKV